MVRVFDAEGCVLGRLASATASTLMDTEEEIAVVNAEKAIVTGEKNEVFDRYRAKYNRGTQRKGPFFPRIPHKIVKRTVRGMVPYSKPKGREAYKRLKCYIGVPDELADEEIETLEDAKPKSVTPHVEIQDISRQLGAKV